MRKVIKNLSRCITAFGALALIVFVVPQAFAANGDLASQIKMYDTNANGKIDQFVVEIVNSFPGGEDVNLTAGWLVTDGNQNVTISTVTISGLPFNNPLVLHIDLDESDPDLTVDTLNSDLEISYTLQNFGNGTDWDLEEEITAIATGDGGDAFAIELDVAAPVPISATFYDSGTADGELDLITVVWSEVINNIANAANEWVITSASDFSTIAEVSAYCNTGLTETNECDYNFTNVGTSKTDVGDLQLVYTPGNVADGLGNSASTYTFNSSSASTTPLIPAFTDGAAPYPKAADLYDTDGDGKVNLITTTWSEPLATAVNSAADWAVSSPGSNFTNFSEGDVVCSYGGASSNECDYHFTTSTLKTDVGDLTLDYTAGTSIKDAVNNTSVSHTFNSGSTVPLADKAAPATIDFKYLNSTDGKPYAIEVTFSENTHANSVLAANDLTFTNVGDFTGAAFGTDNTDVANGGTSEIITLGTPSQVVDTYEDSGNIAVSSQNAFSLEDSSGNINTTLGAQGQATFTDGASPVIKDFEYQDNDGDGKMDQFLVTFSETVTAASTLTASALIFSTAGADVGDFTGAVFGADATDAVTTSTTTATIVLGTESSAQDTSEDSATISIDTQSPFSLTDAAANTNTSSASQDHATFSDGAAPYPISATFYDSATADGLLDLITILWTETVNAVADGTADWAVSSAANFGSLAEGIVTCGGSGVEAVNECDYNLTTTTTKTDVGDLTLAYTTGSVTDGTNSAVTVTFDSASTPPLTDGAAPFPVSATFYDDAVADGILNRIRVIWSEDINSTSVVGDWAATGSNFAGITEADADCGGNDGEPLNACDVDITTTTQKTDVGDLQLVYTPGPIADTTVSANPALGHTFNFSSTVPFTDAAKPFPISATFLDPDVDGLLDLITIIWTETVNAVADGTADWAVSSATNFGSLAEGIVTCGGSGVEAVNECDYNFLTAVVKTDVGDLNLAYTAGTSVTDGTNTAASVTFSSSAPAFTDGAAPVFVSAVANSDTNVNIVMSEPVAAGTLAFGAAADWNATGLTSSAVAESSGTINMTIGSLLGNTAYAATDFAFDTANGGVIEDAATNATLPFTGKTIADGQDPTITTGELIADESACNDDGNVVCKIGEVITFTWDNSVATGDGNTDISTVTADLTNFGGSATQTLYDTGTLGDAQIGDEIYSYAYTVVADDDDDDGAGSTFTATATDTNANSATPVASTDTASVDNIAPIFNAAGSISFFLDNGVGGVAEIGDQVSYTAATVTDGDTDTFSINLSILTGDSAATVAGNPHTVIPGILNASYAFTETATDNAGNETTGFVAAIVVDNASGTGFNSSSVGIGDLTASASTYADVSFDATLDLPADGKISITFPSGFDVSGVTTTSNVSASLTGSLAIGISDQIVTLTRSGGAILGAATSASFRLSPVINPSATGITGNFGLSTKTSANIVLSNVVALPGVTITAIPVPAPTPTPNVVIGGGGGGGGGGGSYFLSVSKSLESGEDTSDEGAETTPHGAAPASITAFVDTFGHWAQTYIDKIAELGIVQGKTPTQYAPDDDISRAELLKVAVNSFDYAVAEEVAQSPLPDVAVDSWYAPFVISAFESGIIYGFDSGLGPNIATSRGMAVTVLAKAAGFDDIEQNFSDNYSSNEEWTYAKFPDVLMEAYYAPFVAYLYDKGIIDGYEDGTFGPGNSITRAEIAKIVVNILEISTP